VVLGIHMSVRMGSVRCYLAIHTWIYFTMPFRFSHSATSGPCFVAQCSLNCDSDNLGLCCANTVIRMSGCGCSAAIVCGLGYKKTTERYLLYTLEAGLRSDSQTYHLVDRIRGSSRNLCQRGRSRTPSRIEHSPNAMSLS